MRIERATITVAGIVDGMGNKHLDGSYLKLYIQPHGTGEPQMEYVISLGGAESLRDEIDGALKVAV